MKKLLLTLPLLAACATAAPPGKPISGDACGARGYAGLVGRPLAATSFPADLNMRLIRPGDLVTADFQADRINLKVDDDGIITEVSCG